MGTLLQANVTMEIHNKQMLDIQKWQQNPQETLFFWVNLITTQALGIMD